MPPSQDAKVDLKPLIVSAIPIYSFSETINLFYYYFFILIDKLITFSANYFFLNACILYFRIVFIIRYLALTAYIYKNLLLLDKLNFVQIILFVHNVIFHFYLVLMIIF